jgi:hypothetical protein
MPKLAGLRALAIRLAAAVIAVGVSGPGLTQHQFLRDTRFDVDVDSNTPRIATDSQLCPHRPNRSASAKLGFETCNSYSTNSSMWISGKKLQHLITVCFEISSPVLGRC